MSGIKKIQKEDIINSALEIVRETGFNNIQARNIAKKLNCSTQPIFYQFANMEELKKEVIEKVLEIFREYMKVDEKASLPYKEVGKGYIRFAKEEPKLFQLIFMSENNLTPENFMTSDKKSYRGILKHVGRATGISSEKEASSFHLRMWTFTHGIATMIATKTCEISEEQISEMLTDEFKALMLLEKMKGENKSE
ncbi:MAG: TetR/AcrR family transcriptional regulator [Clostridia bacterium]